MPRFRPSLLAVPLLTAALSCGGQSVDEHRVTAAVREYNLALTRAFSAKDPQLLEGVATVNEAARVEALVWGLAGRGLVLDGRQEDFRVEKVELPDETRAELTSVETWWYRHHDPANTEAAGQAPRRVRYRLVYELLKVEAGWRVDRLRELGTEELPLG